MPFLFLISPNIVSAVAPESIGFYEAKCYYGGWFGPSPGCWYQSADTIFYTPCWSGSWAGNPCGRVRFLSWIWSSGIGNGTLIVTHNGLEWVRAPFEIKGLTFKKVSGDGQTSIVSSVAPEPLRVRLVDWNGNGFPGKKVEFYAVSGPRRSSGFGVMTSPTGTPSSYVVVQTDSEGYAQVYAVLGDMEGDYTFEAECWSADEGISQYFTLKAAGEAKVDVIRITATGDVELPGIKDPVFLAGFNPDGSLLVTKDDPVAEFPNDAFILNIELGSFPQKPVWTPTVDWSWQLLLGA